MKRRHNRKQVIDFCKKVRLLKNDVVFGADIIAGFPTETDEMFQESMDLVKECNLTHLHIFPYSIRNNTPAARMPQVPKDIIKKRARELREEGKRQMDKYFQKQIGKYATVLVEQVKENFSFGKSQHFTKIKLSNINKEGDIVKCIITDFEKDVLNAKII
jgi:threonylcarbamoyladenosine tRNA methylthiotransferase MtaB